MSSEPNLLTGPAFAELFTTFDHTAFRLEVRDRYDSPPERGTFARFLAGEPLDMTWFEGWLSMIRKIRAEGKVFERVRVVTVPLTDYSRFALFGARLSNEAGEDIRYLDRKDADGLPDFDYWVFDSRRVAKLHFTDDDQPLGAEIITDPAVVVELLAVRDDARHRSLALEEFEARITRDAAAE